MGNEQGKPVDNQNKRSKRGKYDSVVVETAPPAPTKNNNNKNTGLHSTQPKHVTSPPKQPSIDLLSTPLPAGGHKTINPIQANPIPVTKPISKPQDTIAKQPTVNHQKPSNTSSIKQVNTNSSNTQSNKPPTVNRQNKTVSTEEFHCGLSPSCGNSYSACHLNITGLDQVSIDCLFEAQCTKLDAEYWLLYVPIPPLTSFQGEGKVSIKLPSSSVPKCKKILDHQGRELLQVIVPVSEHPHFRNVLQIAASFQVSLFSRELFYDPNVQIPYQMATNEELVFATSDGGSYILTDKHFHSFLKENGKDLFRNPSEVREEGIIYAQRVFHFISDKFKYIEDDPNDNNILHIINNKKSNSAGLSLLFCAILRCQELPARVIYGRLTDSPMKPYAISEFFIEEVGWIPADIGAMICKGKSLGKKQDGKLPFFGEQKPNFIALHYDSSFQLDSIKYGVKNIDTLQNLPFWVSGNGDSTQIRSRSAWKEVNRTPVQM